MRGNIAAARSTKDFFGYLKNEARTDARIIREKTEEPGQVHEHDSVDGLGGLHIDERRVVEFMATYDSRSHGESFLDLPLC